MAKNQNKYTPEFKKQIVDLYATGNYSIPHLESEYGAARNRFKVNTRIVAGYILPI